MEVSSVFIVDLCGEEVWLQLLLLLLGPVMIIQRMKVVDETN